MRSENAESQLEVISTNPKLSQRLAEQIAREIISEKKPEGHFLGNQATLLEKYKISRDTLRESIRILDWQGVIRSVSGQNGGFFVSKPSHQAAKNIIRDYIELTDITHEEVMEARRILETLGVMLATKNLRDDDINELKTQLNALNIKNTGNRSNEIQALLQLLRAVCTASENPILNIFIEPLNYACLDFPRVENLSEASYSRTIDVARNLLKALVDSIIANDEVSAANTLHQYLEVVRQFMGPASIEGKEVKNIFPEWYETSANRLAHSLVYLIKRDIIDSKLEPGERLGSEPELIEKYSVSRSIFREAIRILEFIGLIQAREGRGGGLIVSEADPTNAISAVVLFFESADITKENILETRLAIDEFTAQKAAENLNETDSHILHEALFSVITAKDKKSFITATKQLQLTITTFSQNRVIELYANILIGSSIFKETTESLEKKAWNNREKIIQSHQNLAQAILAKDGPLARRRARNHRLEVAKYLYI